MDLVRRVVQRDAPGYSPLLSVSTNKFPDVMAFLWDGSDVVPKWVSPSGSDHAIQDMSTLHQLAMGIQLIEADGRLEVKLPILERQVFLVSSPSGSLDLIFFDKEGQPCMFDEIYVELMNEGNSPCVCKCRKVTGEEFIQKMNINLGFMASLM